MKAQIKKPSNHKRCKIKQNQRPLRDSVIILHINNLLEV